MNKKYCIYYITTGPYINYADGFFNSLVNFMPNSKKDVIWLSDNFTTYNLPNIEIKPILILDMPWPLITLLKMHYIVNNKIKGYDGYFYFNGNSKLIDMSEDTIILLNTLLDNNKLIVTKHTCDLNKGDYVLAGFFGGSENIFFDVCLKVVTLIDKSLKNNIIFDWHDETALNKVLKENNIPIYLDQFGLNAVNTQYLKLFKYVFLLLDNDKYKKDKQ